MVIYYDIPFLKDQELNERLWGWFLVSSNGIKVEKKRVPKFEVFSSVIGIKKKSTYDEKFGHLLEAG